MISYAYAKLAIGESVSCGFSYFDQTVQFIQEKNLHNDAKVYVVTDKTRDVQVQNLIRKNITENEYPFFLKDGGRNYAYFNFALKSLALEFCYDNTDAEYIIYTDSDFLLHDEYTEVRLQNYLQLLKDDGCDIFTNKTQKIDFEDQLHYTTNNYRPYSFKLKNYDLTNYMNGEVISHEECFIILKKNDKVKKFIDRWKELYWYMVENKIMQYADMLEIGMAAYDAKLINTNLPNAYIHSDEANMSRMFYTPYCSDTTTNFVFFSESEVQ